MALLELKNGGVEATGRIIRDAVLKEVGQKQSLLLEVSIAWGSGDKQVLTFKSWNPLASRLGSIVKKDMYLKIYGHKKSETYKDKNTGEDKTSFSCWIDFVEFLRLPGNEMVMDTQPKHPTTTDNAPEGFTETTGFEEDLPF